ncbi:hypothetical protein [Blautia hydrogenotrophica]|uniref:hypothetical protein n=1 Tax=Blautia hydrogenotrophica TaxID=53443 RepID=UPI003AB40ADB
MLFRKQVYKDNVHSLQVCYTDSSPPKGESAVSGKASFCASAAEGSLTVECALVLFLFFVGIATILSFFEIFQIQVQRQYELRERAEEIGMEYSSRENAPKEVEIPDFYIWRAPISAISLPPVPMYSKLKVHTWTGYREENGAVQEEKMVYIADTGKVYHLKSTCSYLRVSLEAVSAKELPGRRNESGGKYYPCERCIEDGKKPSIVYITGSGDHYHGQITCGGLKRTVRMVPLSQVKGWLACSRCGG